MSLEQTLSADIVTAMRAKDATRLTALAATAPPAIPAYLKKSLLEVIVVSFIQ